MNTSKKLSVLLLQVLLLGATAFVNAEPVPYNKPDLVWTKSANSRTGRYITKGTSVAQAISLTLDAAYYYGDVENRGLALAGGPLFADNICGMAKINYSQPVASMLNIRYSIGGGVLRGNNERYADKMYATDSPLSYRKFQSWILNGAVGVEIFPIPEAGFYIYAGVMLNYSNVRMDYGKSAPDGDWLYNWKNNSFLPMIPVELGYQFKLKKSWLMNVHLGFAQGLGDTETLNLDGYPHDFSGRGSGTAAGLSGTMGKSTKQWFDGWFNVGVTISYSWHNCEICRLRKW
ncbi:MAG: hypothetical protein IJ776_09830 [Paludibacteraceae bacterium]|nr:hypothetical protein [Paludibacteraceae bacterium]